MAAPCSSPLVLAAFSSSAAPSAAAQSSASAAHFTAATMMMEDEPPSAASSASSSPSSVVDGTSLSSVAAAGMDDPASSASLANAIGSQQHPHTQSTAPQGALLAQPAASAAASESSSSRKRAFIDDDDGEVPSSDQPRLFAVDGAGQPLSSDHLSKKTRASHDDAAPTVAGASSSSLAPAPDAASSSLDFSARMIDEPVSNAAAEAPEAAAAATPAGSALAALPATASMSDVDHGSAAAEASSSSASSSVPPSALPTSSAPVDSWSDREKLRRAREDNGADRAALLMESGMLNELQTCFQLANDRLGLPYIPTDLLRIIAGYAERLADEPASLAAIVVSTFLVESRTHKLMHFASEAEFRAFVKRIILDEPRLMECLGECKAAWEEARLEFTSTLPAQIQSIQTRIASALESHDTLRWLRSQLRQLADNLQTEQKQHRVRVSAECLDTFARNHPSICFVLDPARDRDLEHIAAWLDEDSVGSSTLSCFVRAGNAHATIDQLCDALFVFLRWTHPGVQVQMENEFVDAPMDSALVAPEESCSAATDLGASRTMLDYFPRQMRQVQHAWSKQKLQERTRAINNADRAALLSGSARLNELQTCFQLAHDRLGLPLMPTSVLELVCDYASRIPTAPRVLCVVFSIVRRLPDEDLEQSLLRFDSEAAFRAHVHRVMIEETQFAEYVIAREAAQLPDYESLACQLAEVQDALYHAFGETDSSERLRYLLWDFAAAELGGDNREEARADWEARFFTEFAKEHPRVLAVLNAELIREGSLTVSAESEEFDLERCPAGVASLAASSSQPQGSVLSRVKAVGSLETPLSEVVIAFQHFLQFSDANSVSSRFCIVHETD